MTTPESYATSRQIADSIFGLVEWISGEAGYCSCPGATKHTRSTGPRDCKIIISGAPTAYCFHQSCGAEIDRANFELRRQIGKSAFRFNSIPDLKRNPTKEKAESAKLLTLRAQSVLHQVFENYRWTV